MRILALIPARGGSKRVIGKNLRTLGGKPLIVWTIESVSSIPEICETVVSTDDSAIAEIAIKAGATVLGLRPDFLSSDEASTMDVARYELSKYQENHKEVDGLLILQPTSPFRTREIISHGIEIFRSSNFETVVGVSPVRDHPSWVFVQEDEHLMRYSKATTKSSRWQDLESAFVLNGSFYLATPDFINGSNSFTVDGVLPLLVNSEKESWDIDTEFDFRIAEYLAND